MRPCRFAAIAIAVFGCGDHFIPEGPPLARIDTLAIVAHPDDDLIFLQPELRNALGQRRSITTVFVTAGQARKGALFARDRQRGVLFAYQQVTRTEGWLCGSIPLNEKPVMNCRSDDGAGTETLVFLNLPDGGIDGSFPGSLSKLWRDPTSRAGTIGVPTADYNRDQVVEALADIVGQTSPSEIWTLDTIAVHGHDHEDHAVVGAATVAAAALAGSNALIRATRGYNITEAPTNKSSEDVALDSNMLRAYYACVDRCGRCGSQACSSITPFHQSLIERKYRFSLPASRGTGRLAAGDLCLGGSGQLMACAKAPAWDIADSRLRLAGESLCLVSSPTLTTQPCRNSPDQWWRMTDEGYLVSGNLAMATNTSSRTYAPCLVAAEPGALARVVTCGGNIGQVWQLLPTSNEATKR